MPARRRGLGERHGRHALGLGDGHNGARQSSAAPEPPTAESGPRQPPTGVNGSCGRLAGPTPLRRIRSFSRDGRRPRRLVRASGRASSCRWADASTPRMRLRGRNPPGRGSPEVLAELLLRFPCPLGRHRRRDWHSRVLHGWDGRSLRHVTGRQERERVDIATRVVCPADTELDVWRVPLGGRTDRAHRLALGHAVAHGHRDRAEMRERDCPAIRRTEGHRLAVGGKRAGECHHAVLGRADVGALGAGDVDPTVP